MALNLSHYTKVTNTWCPKKIINRILRAMLEDQVFMDCLGQFGLFWATLNRFGVL